MSRPRHGPVPRRAVFLGLLAMLLAIGATVVLVDSLRHPPPDPTARRVPADPLDGDPRVPLVCPDPIPREGVQRPIGDRPQPPERVTSSELYDCPGFWDGRSVTYRGEVVGAMLRRGDVTWTQLNDDIYAETLGPLPAHRDFRGGNAGVGVALPPGVAERVAVVGGPGAQGDVLEVRGTFHRVDPVSGEITVMRATSAEIVRPGARIEEVTLVDRRVVAYLAAALALALAVAERVVAGRR